MAYLEVDGSSGELRISDAMQQVLREQTIDETVPGTVLQDFETLLDYIGERGLKTTSKHYLLPQRCLVELNSRMIRPMAYQLKRPQQRSFSLLNGLYLLLRATGLGIGLGAAPSGTLAVNPESLMMWRQLNPTERYFALLENWLMHASTDTIGEADRWSSNCMNSVMSVCNRLSRQSVIRIEDSNKRYGIVYGTMDALTISLMDSFGWMSTEYEPPANGQTQQLSRVELLPFGRAMTQSLMAASLGKYPGPPENETQGPGVLQPLFKSYFPSWERNLELPEPEIRPGKYTWRVSIGKPWRRIVVPGDFPLESLADAILQAFDFDNDHMYHFEFRDERGQCVEIVCPHIRDAEAWADEVALQELPLADGATMTFVFDYGDYWKFTVKLEDVTDDDPTLTEAKVIKCSGKAPPQYDWGDD
ncbi:MAG: plasmid pRiA4b ORF-3 family protein [Fuerstiella sp.]